MMKQFAIDARAIDASTRARVVDEREGSFKFTRKTKKSLSMIQCPPSPSPEPQVAVNSLPLPIETLSFPRDDDAESMTTSQAVASYTSTSVSNKSHIVKWDEDRLVWEIETQGLSAKHRKNIAEMLHITEGSLQVRLVLLRQVYRSVSLRSISLADPATVEIWRFFQGEVTSYRPNTVMRLYAKPIQSVSQQLGLSVAHTEDILRQIRDLKHYLHFAGIHHDAEDPGAADSLHTEEARSDSSSDPKIKTETERWCRSYNYSLVEKQYIYDRRVKYGCVQTPYNEMAEKLGRPESTLSHQRDELRIIARDAAMAVEEGVSLAPGPDTCLWYEYLQTLSVRNRATMDTPIISANVQTVASTINKSLLQVQLRLKLIRTVKRFLFIAGVHEEEGLERKFAQLGQAPVIQKDSDSVTHTMAQENLLLRDTVSTTVSDTISTIEEANTTTEIADELHTIVTTIETNHAVSAEVSLVVEELMCTTQSNHETNMEVTVVAEELVAGVVSNTAVTLLLHDLCCTVESAQHVLPLTAAPLTTNPDVPCTTTAAAYKPPVYRAKGMPYSVEDDRVVWSAWQQLNPALHNDFAARKALEVAVARQVRRTDRGIERRLVLLRELEAQAEEVVERGTTLLPSDILHLWQQYTELAPQQRVNSTYIDLTAVDKFAGQAGSAGELVAGLQAVCALKWYLLISGVVPVDCSGSVNIADAVVPPNFQTVSLNKTYPQMYTPADDCMLWHAWQQLGHLQHDGAARKVLEADLAARVNRTVKAIERRLGILRDIETQAENAVESGATLLPGDALDTWHRYSELAPPQRPNSAHIDMVVVRRLLDDPGASCANLVADLQEICAMRWFLLISGVHTDAADNSGSNCSSQSSGSGSFFTARTGQSAEGSVDSNSIVADVDYSESIHATLEDLVETVDTRCEVHGAVDCLVADAERTVQTHNTVKDVLWSAVDSVEYDILVRDAVTDVVQELVSYVEYSVQVGNILSEVLQEMTAEVETAAHSRDTVQNMLQDLVSQTDHNVVSDALQQVALEMEYTAHIRVIASDLLHDLAVCIECNAQVHNTITDVLQDLTQQVEQAVIPVAEPDDASSSGVEYSEADSTSAQPQSSLSSLPLPTGVLPFVFKLHDEGEIWRAYLQHQHNPATNLCSRLTELSQRLGCTFAQARDHLNKLINLHLGLSAQQHSAGRAFTATEDKSIWAALKDTTPITYAMALLLVSQRIRCAMGIVAARHRQLRTLDLMEAVRVEVQAQHAVLVHMSSGNKSKADRTGEKRKASVRVVCKENKRQKTGVAKVGMLEVNVVNEVAYFSTEGESGDESM